jgi:cell wall-associated NlpC family hydrolase
MAANRYMRNNKASNYIKQLNKSFGYAVGDVFDTYAPTTSSLIKSTRNIAMDAKTSMRKMRKNSVSQATQDLDTGNDRYSNILDDIISSAENNILNGNNDSLKLASEDWGDENTSEDAKNIMDQNDSNSKQILGSLSNFENSVSRIVGTAASKSAQYIAKSQIASTKALYDLNKQGFTQITNVLLGMNDTLTNIASLSQPLSAHMHNASIFFTTTSDTLNKMQGTLEKIEKNTSKANNGPGGKGGRNKSYENFIDEDGNINLKGYFGMVKENAKDQMEIINKVFGDGKKSKRSNKNVPLMQQVITTAIEFAMPKFAKSSLEMFDEKIRGMFTSALSEAGIKFRKSKNPIAAILGSIFLPKDGFRKSPNTANYNKGQVAWDGIARKSLVEVIPTYLAKIYAAMGGEERYYDYNVGKFVTLKNIRGKQEYDRAKAAKVAGGEFREDALRKAKQSGNPEIQKEIEAYFRNALEMGTGFSDLKSNKNNKDYKKSLGLTDESFEILLNLLEAYEKSPVKTREGYVRNRATNFRAEVARQRNKIGKKMNKAEQTGDIGLNYIYNGFGSSENKVGSSFIDKNGNSSLDYLRGIYMLLGSGSFGGRGPKGTKKFKIGKISDKGTQGNTNNNSDNMNYKYYGLSDEQIEEKKEQEKMEKAWEKARDKFEGKSRNALNRKPGTPSEDNSKFKNAIIKVKNVYEKPFELLSGLITSFSDNLNTLFWGTEGKPGLVERMYNKFDEISNNFKDKLQEKFKKWFGNSEPVQKFKDQFKSTWGDVKSNFKEKATNVKNKFLYGNTVAQQLSNIAKDGGIGTAATGRKVTKSGVVVVSEGEMIIPSELNPYYNGITNKQRQINNENKIASNFLGTYAKGGEVGDDNYIHDDETGKIYRKVVDENGNAIRGEEVKDPDEKKKAATSIMSHLKRKTIDRIFDKDKQGKFKNTADSAFGVIGQGASMLGGGIVKFISDCFGREDPEKDKDKVMGVIKDSFSEMGNNKGAMAIGALGGVGVSLLTGGLIGPIAAGAIGAGVGLISKSEKMQNKLFGYTDEKGNFQEGLFKKDTADFLKNNVPAMGKGGAIGGVLGAFAGSPVLGAILGGTLGYVSSSEKAKTFLFGNEEKDGVISKELQKKVKDAAPNMAAGALAGLFIGPFGVVGNLMVGAGIGYLSKSEEFGRFLFGDENGKGGLTEKIREKILGNIDGIFRNIGNRIKGFGKNLGRSIKSRFKTMGQTIKDRISRKAKSKDGSIGSKLASVAEGIINFPVNAGGFVLGGINKKIQKGNLKKGYDVYNAKEKRNATAAEREEMRADLGMKSSNFDKMLAQNKDKENLVQLKDLIGNIQEPGRAYKRIKSKEITEMYKTLQANGVDQKDIDKIAGVISGPNGQNRALKIVTSLKIKQVASGKDMKKQAEAIRNAVIKCFNEIAKAKDERNLKKNSKQLLKDKFGIDASDKDLMKYGDLIDTELKNNDIYSEESQNQLKEDKHNESVEKHQTVMENKVDQMIYALNKLAGISNEKAKEKATGKFSSETDEEGITKYFQNNEDGSKSEISMEDMDQAALDDNKRAFREKFYDGANKFGNKVKSGVGAVAGITGDILLDIGKSIAWAAQNMAKGVSAIYHFTGSHINQGIERANEKVADSREIEDYSGNWATRTKHRFQNARNRVSGGVQGTFSKLDKGELDNDEESASGSGLKRLFRKLSGGASDENKVHTEYTMAGPVQYTVNNQGEATIDDRDKETQETMKKNNSFFDAIKSVPSIGTAIGGLSGLMGKLKDGLLGNEEENKEGLLSKLMGKLFGDDGILSGLFGFFTGSKNFGKKLLSKISLKTVFADIIAPALLIGGFSGKFDTIANKLTNGAYGDTKDEVTGTTKDGRTVTQTTDENGNTIWIDENGNVVSDSEVVSAASRKMDTDSAAAKLTKNTVREALKGKNSFATRILGKTTIGKKLKGSKIATGLKNWNKSLKTSSSAVEKMTSSQVIKEAQSLGQQSMDDVAEAALKQANGLGDDIVDSTSKKLVKEAGEQAIDATFSSSIMESLQKAGEKLAPKLAKLGISEERTTAMFSSIGQKISKALTSNTAKNIAKFAGQVVVVARIAMVVMDFVTGYEDARTTLGITKDPTTGQRILAGVLRVVKNLIPIVGSLIPDSLIVDVACDYIAPALGIDVSELKQSREEAKQDIEDYNKANGTNISSVEEFNKSVLKDYTTTERMGNALKSTKEDIKQKWKNAKSTIKEKGFKGYISDTFSTMTSDFMNSYKEEGGGLAGLSAGISEAFGNQLPGMFGNITKANGEIRTNAIKGELGKMWKVTLPNFSGGGEKVNGTNLTTAVPSLFSKVVGQIPLIVTKLTMSPIGLISALGKKIKQGIDGITDKIKIASEDVTKNNDKLKAYSDEGDISGLWHNKVEISEDNPLGGYLKINNFANKLSYTVPALFHKMGNSFKSFTTSISSKNEENIDSYSKAISKMQKHAKKGDLSKVRKVSFKITENTPVGKMLSTSFWIQKQYYTVISLFNKMGNGLKKVGGKIKDVFTSIFGTKDTSTSTSSSSSTSTSTVTTTNSDNTTSTTSNSTWLNSRMGVGLVTNEPNTNTSDTDQTDSSDTVVDDTSGGSSGFVSQYDPRYQKYSISGKNFASKGCGPSVAAMAAQSMGKSLSVGDAVSESRGYQNSNGVSADYFGKVFNEKGIRARYISGGSSADLYSSIAQGDKVVLLGRDPYNTSKDNSPFGPNNHYVLATGLDRSGNVIVNDPESNGPRSYNPSILNSAKLGIAGSASGLKKIPRRKRLWNRISGGDSSYDTDVARQVWAFWTGAGYSAAATAGIMGNIYQESGMNPASIQGNGKGPAAGLFQWESYTKNDGRFLNMKNYASSRGKDWTDLDSQLNFAKSEFESNDCTRILEGKAGKSAEIFSDAGISVSQAMSLDKFKAITDVALATALFEAAFERAGKPNMQRRQEAAAAYYNLYSGSHYEYTGTYDSANTSSDSSSSSGSLFSNAVNLISDISTVFSNAFEGSSDDSSSSSSASSDSVVTNAAVGDGNSTQKALAQKLLDIQGKLTYSMEGPRDPDKGSADCSSTVNWAYKKVTGTDIGNSTDAIINNSNTEIIDLANNMSETNGGNNSSGPTESKLMPGDILLYSRPNSGYSAGRKYRVGHVEMYVGNGQRIGHGGGMGPKVSPLTQDSNRYIEARRLKGIADFGPGNNSGNGSGLIPMDYEDIAMASGGSSGLLLSSRIGSRNNIRRQKRNTLIRKNYNFSGGDSNIADETTSMLSNIKQDVQSRASSGSISTDTVNKLITSITNLLQSIANNTADITSIYNVLKSYVAGSGSKDNSNKDDTVVKKTTSKPKTSIVSSSTNNGSDEIDSNIVSLVSVLADIAKA